MVRFTREQKLDIYQKRKSGAGIAVLSKQYDISYGNAKYLVILMDTYDEDILRKDKNNYFSPELKAAIEECIVYYISQRITAKLKGLTPVEYRS